MYFVLIWVGFIVVEGALRAHSLASRIQVSSSNANVDELHNLPGKTTIISSLPSFNNIRIET